MAKKDYQSWIDEDGTLWETWKDRSGESQMMATVGYGIDYGDGIPEGCAACGGDYPNCTSSCPLFDD